MLLLTVIVFVVLLLAVVLVHEWGHFMAAKRAGCQVEEFGFGFPPKILGVKWHGTLYSLNLIPLGGFVKIEGEDMTDANPTPSSFAGKSASWRIFILAAGVTMNVVLAWVLLSVQGLVGVPTIITEDNQHALSNLKTYVLSVAPNSPAEAAGLQEFDRLVRVGSVHSPSVAQVQDVALAAQGQEIEIVINRQGVDMSFQLAPRSTPPANEGPLGVSLTATGLQKVVWWKAPWHGLQRTWLLLTAIVAAFGGMLSQIATTGTISGDIAGPVGIAVLTNEVTNLGLAYILEFSALISLNLALINIFPFPALDGGRIVFVLLEILRGGKKMSAHIERYVHAAGFAFLIILMLLITFRDIKRFF